MIQDSINQMLGAVAIGSRLGGDILRENKATKLQEIESQLKGNRELSELTRETNFNALNELRQNNIDTSTPEGAKEWKKLEEENIIQNMEKQDMLDDLESQKKDMYKDLEKMSGKREEPRKATQVKARTIMREDASKRAYYAQSKYREAMNRVSNTASAMQEQANNNFTTNFGKSSELPPKMKEFVENEMKKGGNV